MAPFVSARAPHALASEGGLLESYQAGLWALSIVSAVGVSATQRDRRSRWETLLLLGIAVAALLRECDLHTRLNPEHLGVWGVRYRLDWWTDFGVPLGVKIAWAAAFASVAAVAALVVVRSRAPIRWRNPRPRLLVAAAVMMAAGFFMDDLLRGIGPQAWRVIAEESAELLASVFFLGAVLDPTPATGPAKPERPPAARPPQP